MPSTTPHRPWTERGSGLYIARGLIELHGGLITVDSQPGVFTEFTVLLPFKHDPRWDVDPPARE